MITEVKLNDTAISTVFIQSFANEKAFVEAGEKFLYPELKLSDRRNLLKKAYKLGNSTPVTGEVIGG